MRTRRAFKRTIGILAVLLILSAALNIALIIMLSKANGGANAAEPTPTPEMSDTAALFTRFKKAVAERLTCVF